jgi:hypothetical protein
VGDFQTLHDMARMAQARATIAWLFPDAEVLLDGATVVVLPKRPWWAIGPGESLWLSLERKVVLARCRERVPAVCGWCPAVRVE